MFNACVAQCTNTNNFALCLDWQLNYLQGYVSQMYTRSYKASIGNNLPSPPHRMKFNFVGHFAAISLPTKYLEKYSQTSMALQDNLSIFLYIKTRIQALQNSLEWKRLVTF